LIALCVFASTSAAAPTRFQTLYDHYFPNDEYQNGEYRRLFDNSLFGPPPKPDAERHPVYSAFRGDAVAFHAFVQHPDRDGMGEFTLTWIKEVLVLLLRLDDDRFSELLACEGQHTRESVGAVIDCQIDWTKHPFPKTRALYSYRYIRPSHQALEKKHGNGVSTLIASLAKEKRFARVRIYNRKDENGSILITAPNSLSEKDKTALRRLMTQCVGEDASLIVE
jgi:hypothetical protein